MNVRLQFDSDFSAGVYHDSHMLINQYALSIGLITQCTDHAQYNIALQRIRAFVEGELDSTVFINQQNGEVAELMSLLGIDVTPLPADPIDQIIGMMLFYKLNAVADGRLSVVQLDIKSNLGGVWYQHDDQDPAGPFANEGWWCTSTPEHSAIQRYQDNNVVKVFPASWSDYDLAWPDEQVHNDNTVVYADFPKHEK